MCMLAEGVGGEAWGGGVPWCTHGAGVSLITASRNPHKWGRMGDGGRPWSDSFKDLEESVSVQ